LFRFDKTQKIFEIGKIRIGGQPGELPTVLIGSIFYSGHKIVQDPKKGVFDKSRAEELINKQDELSEKYGIPCIIDLVGTSPEAWLKYADFVSNITDSPFLLDGVKPIRMGILKSVNEIGLSDRIIYDSIYFDDKEEIEGVKNSKIKAAVLLAFNVRDPSAKGCVSIVKGDKDQRGLLEIGKEAGIEKYLVDTCGTNVPHSGVASKGAFLVKEELGLPAGFSPENVSGTIKKTSIEKEAILPTWAGVQLVPLALGSDFLLYGPIEKAQLIFPACAVVNSMIVAVAKELGTKTLVKDHPIQKLFPDLAKKLEII
jgi:tetrahydromethanopterin S-methyltransferase subunit H